MLVTLVNTQLDEKLAARIHADLKDAQINVGQALQEGAVCIVILSEVALQDRSIMRLIDAALDQYIHVLPILAQPVALPKVIDNLQPLDFSGSYSREALLQTVEKLAAPDAPKPLTALTEERRKANQRAAVFYIVLVILGFIIGLIGVGIFGIQAPPDEYASVDTQVFFERKALVDSIIPRNTDEALAFPATLERYSRDVREEIMLTVTAVAVGSDLTYVPRSTEQATYFMRTLTVVSTHAVQRLSDLATRNAMTAAVITPTPGGVTAEPLGE